NQAAFLAEPKQSIIPTLERESVLEMVVNQRFELEVEDFQGRLLVRPEALCLYSTLVWKPCRESLSPLWPFYMLTVGDSQLYIRIDGRVFTHLHDGDHGI
ncbi:unnamed protein product, partial [marine sediment metagenome]